MTRPRTISLGFLAAIAALAVLASLSPFATPHALASEICAGSPCTSAEVGPFMAGISEQCGDFGTCSLADIQTVFYNIGNWILGVVGALVFLAYVVGGFYFLLSNFPGMEKLREKGKTALKQSTVGLVIVFVAFAAIQTLKSVLTGGGISPTGNEIACGPGPINSGMECGLNSRCTDAGTCMSLCEIEHPITQSNGGSLSGSNDTLTWGACVDVNTASTNYGFAGTIQVIGGPEQGKCWGGDEIQCVVLQAVYDL